MKIVIVEAPGKAVVGVIEDWQGPLPSVGEYIFHPPAVGRPETNVMGVKSVTWRMLSRKGAAEAGHFTGTPEPYVEIHV